MGIRVLPLVGLLVQESLVMMPWCILIMLQVLRWVMLKALRLNPNYHYNDADRHIPMIWRSWLSGKLQIGGKWYLLVSISMLMIMGVLNLVWGWLCCHSYWPLVECFPWWTQWFYFCTWPQFGLRVSLSRSSSIMVSLVPSLLLECTVFHNWIWFSKLLSSVLILTDSTHHFLFSPAPM